MATPSHELRGVSVVSALRLGASVGAPVQLFIDRCGILRYGIDYSLEVDDLEGSLADYKGDMAFLKENNWVDDLTRALAIHFVVFNGNWESAFQATAAEPSTNYTSMEASSYRGPVLIREAIPLSMALAQNSLQL